MNKAKEIIHSYADNILKLEDICEELQLTTFQFIRFLKAHRDHTLPILFKLQGRTCKIDYRAYSRYLCGSRTMWLCGSHSSQ